jgi:hypothetical protein
MHFAHIVFTQIIDIIHDLEFSVAPKTKSTPSTAANSSGFNWHTPHFVELDVT